MTKTLMLMAPTRSVADHLSFRTRLLSYIIRAMRLIIMCMMHWILCQVSHSVAKGTTWVWAWTDLYDPEAHCCRRENRVSIADLHTVWKTRNRDIHMLKNNSKLFPNG